MNPAGPTRFVALKTGGKEGLITNPENIGRALRRETGTWMVRG
jgi:carbamate kinase